MRFSTEFKVGAFVIAVSLAFAFLILTFGEIPFLKPGVKVYKVYFDNVAGLSKGAEVRVAGIKSGKVRSVELKDGKVEVIFEVDKSINLYRDASAQIGTLGLMGDKYLAINPGNPSSGPLSEGQVIQKTYGYADTDRLVKELTNASESMKLMVENFQLILMENREDIRRIVQNLEMLSDSLNKMALENRENLRQTIANLNILVASLSRTLPSTIASIERLSNDLDRVVVENRGDIKESLENLRSLTSDLRTSLPELVKNLNDLSRNLNAIATENRENLRATTSNLAELTTSLKKSSQDLQSILARIERGEGTLGKLVKDEELYRNITSATKTFAKAGEVTDKTNLYIGFRGELYRAGDSKGILSVILQPDNQKYYLLEVVGNSRGRVYREEILPNQTVVKKEFKPEFTLQYARIFPLFEDKYLVLRGGLKESTGGVGADLIYSDRITFTSDLWDFGRKDRPQDKNLKPNFQVGVNYKVKGPLYVRFGGDDLLNSKLRGAFGGVGLLFTDNDLKYLLGAVKIPLP
ncbi:putative phospholipid ABC transporter-binding protein MlaD [bacterium HR13]|nr:putative phospholipid ABC transporter-binding protein MlaD [bacterium HR13]